MPKILLVEDNELNREMLSRRLVRKGFEVVMAVDGLQGVAMAGSDRPDLVLMDMSLPGIDGWEATRQLKANPATHAMPVIALTAHAMSDDRAKALAAGCDDFDTKPVDLERLLGKMQALLPAALQTNQQADQQPTQQPTQQANQQPIVQPQPAWARDLTLRALPQSLPFLQAALDDLCAHASAPRGLRDDLRVVLDEVCANLFKHAYPPGAPGAVRVLLRHLSAPAPGATEAPAAVELTFIDQGLPFNPLTQPEPDVTLPLEDRLPGGLGIHFMRQMTDSQHYSHSATEGNRLRLVKRLP